MANGEYCCERVGRTGLRLKSSSLFSLMAFCDPTPKSRPTNHCRIYS